MKLSLLEKRHKNEFMEAKRLLDLGTRTQTAAKKIGVDGNLDQEITDYVESALALVAEHGENDTRFMKSLDDVLGIDFDLKKITERSFDNYGVVFAEYQDESRRLQEQVHLEWQ